MSYKKFDQADLEVIKNIIKTMKEFYMQKISTKNTVMMN